MTDPFVLGLDARTGSGGYFKGKLYGSPRRYCASSYSIDSKFSPTRLTRFQTITIGGFVTGTTPQIKLLSIIVKALRIVGKNTGSVADSAEAIS